MSIPARLAVFASGLVLAFAGAWGLGGALDPLLDEPSPAHQGGANHDD